MKDKIFGTLVATAALGLLSTFPVYWLFSSDACQFWTDTHWYRGPCDFFTKMGFWALWAIIGTLYGWVVSEIWTS